MSPKLRFNSTILTLFFILSGLSFIILHFTIWTASIKSERVASIRQDARLIMDGITGNLLASTELNNQGLIFQSRSLIQDYLNYMFEIKSNASSKRVLKASVFILNRNREILAEWGNIPRYTKPECVDTRTEYFHPYHSVYPYLIQLSMNSCSDSSESMLEYHALTTPVLISISLVLIWGIFVYFMIRSVSLSSHLLAFKENTDEAFIDTEKIRWLDVVTLTRKALHVRGRNLQFYQTLILDAQHDVSKILDFITRKFSYPELIEKISIIRGIIQKVSLDVRSSEIPIRDVTPHREFEKYEFLKMVESYFSLCKIEDNLPSQFILKVNDIFVFERIFVNLASNAQKHSRYQSKVILTFENHCLKFRVETKISELDRFYYNLAKLTRRIDTKNTHTPVYSKIFGRTGRGLSIIKKGITKIGGKIVFFLSKNILTSGFDLEATLKTTEEAKKFVVNIEKKRFIYFESNEFKQAAIGHGLSQFLIEKSELENIFNSVDDPEIVSDLDIVVPSHITLRIIKKKERIEGLAINWLGDKK